MHRDLPACHVGLTRQGTTTILSARGEIDIATVHLLHSAVREVKPPSELLVIDLSEVTFLDSTAIRALLNARSAADGASIRLIVVVEPGGAAERVLELAGIGEWLTVVHNHA